MTFVHSEVSENPIDYSETYATLSDNMTCQESRYSCETCEKSFVEKDTLIDHRSKFFDGKKFICDKVDDFQSYKVMAESSKRRFDGTIVSECPEHSVVPADPRKSLEEKGRPKDLPMPKFHKEHSDPPSSLNRKIEDHPMYKTLALTVDSLSKHNASSNTFPEIRDSPQASAGENTPFEKSFMELLENEREKVKKTKIEPPEDQDYTWNKKVDQFLHSLL